MIVEKLRNWERVYPEDEDKPDGSLYYEAADRIEELEEKLREAQVKLEKALELYQRERDRFKHNYPEMSGAYFLTGGQGEVDSNQLPEYVRICPAYGCAWEQVYVKTNKTISYEGS